MKLVLVLALVAVTTWAAPEDTLVRNKRQCEFYVIS